MTNATPPLVPPLTIAIPTYNRNAILLESLGHLLPQLNGQCRLLILDNCSPTPVEETLAPLLQKFPDADVVIERHRVNVGANINILRCFERCESTWLWVLGDDDTPLENAIETILEHVHAHPECLYFNFVAHGYTAFGATGGRAQKSFTRGLGDFIDKIENIADALFISSGIYKASVLNEKLRLAFAYAHTQPNFVPLVVSLGEEGVVCLSDKRIVKYNPPSAQNRWPLMYFSLGMMTILELPLAPDARALLARKIQATMPFLGNWVMQLLVLAQKEGDSRGALFFFDQLCARNFYFNTSPKQRAKLRLCRWMLRHPNQSAKILARLFGKTAQDYHVQEQLEGL